MKEKMLILTGLFFNNTGNQSFYETVRGYAKHFEVTLITAADLKDCYYLGFDQAKQLFPDVRLIQTKSAVLNVAKLVKKALFKPSKNRRGVEKRDSKLVNARVSCFSKKAFLVREALLKKEALHLIRTEAYQPKYICAYEINGVKPAIQIKQSLDNDTITFGKFQGTVLGSVVEDLGKDDHKHEYWMDYQALKMASSLDGCIMTNDGTRGKEVLEKFNVDSDKILFVPNGVSELCEKKKFDMERHKRDFNYPIKLFTLSRLVYWKRVDLSVKIIAKLVHHFKDQRFILNIYGPGNKDEVLEIKNLIKKLRVEKYVNYLGSVSYGQTPDVFAKNDILVSLYMMNNITNPVLEAIYYGIPVMTIYKKDLVSIMGERSSSCILLEDSEEERLIMNAANKLNSLKLQDLERLYEEMKYKSTNITTWSNRIKSEISFIENLGGTNK